jgi:hypothetical protein
MRVRAWISAICLICAAPAGLAAEPARLKFPLKVSPDGRRLVDAGGRPFFYLADTAWELFHRLTFEEADAVLRDRAAKGFNVVQAVVLAELGGLTEKTPGGLLPLENNDPLRPQEAYFAHVDKVVKRANELGVAVGLLPTWGDKWNKKWGQGPEIFTPENARGYGEWLGRRYKDADVIWILGGDRPVENERHYAVIRAMAEGLRRGDGGRHLMTFHPQGGQASSQYFHKDGWLSFNMLQTGHDYDRPNYEKILADYRRAPAKPVLDGEPGYEDHPAGFKKENGYLTDADVRKSAYWAAFSGAAGHTYGCHDVWQFYDGKRKPVTFARTPWPEALKLPGSAQVGIMKTLMMEEGYADYAPEPTLVASPNDGKGGGYRAALLKKGGAGALVYLPHGGGVTLDGTKLSGKKLLVSWFDPRTGARTRGTYQDKADRVVLESPAKDEKKGGDWVAVVSAEP